jgi:hypothetical protein
MAYARGLFDAHGHNIEAIDLELMLRSIEQGQGPLAPCPADASSDRGGGHSNGARKVRGLLSHCITPHTSSKEDQDQKTNRISRQQTHVSLLFAHGKSDCGLSGHHSPGLIGGVAC